MPSIKLTHPIRFHGEQNRWMAPSRTDPLSPWMVDMDELECQCPDWQFRHVRKGPGYTCVHIRMVQAEIEMLKDWTDYAPKT